MSQGSQKQKLNPGDKVRCIDNSDEDRYGYGKFLTKNKIYILIVEDAGGAIWVDDDTNHRRGFHPWRFEPAGKNPHGRLKRLLETGEGDAEEIISLFTRT